MKKLYNVYCHVICKTVKEVEAISEQEAYKIVKETHIKDIFPGTGLEAYTNGKILIDRVEEEE